MPFNFDPNFAAHVLDSYSVLPNEQLTVQVSSSLSGPTLHVWAQDYYYGSPGLIVANYADDDAAEIAAILFDDDDMDTGGPESQF